MNTNPDVASLGQVFTPDAVVQTMLGLCRREGRTLEPSAGDGAFSSRIGKAIAIEIDARVAPPGALVGDFFAYPTAEKFDTIIGNPPYVRYQDIRPETKRLLDRTLFDGRTNLYLFFIEKAVRHLNRGGELIFIVPREFIKLTAARRLNEFLYQEGTITHFIETGDSRIFHGAVPNCAIFRFEQGLFDRRMPDGRTCTLVDGQLMFVEGDYSIPLGDLFDVKVGAVSGADTIFTHRKGNTEFVCSKTIDTGATRRMYFGVKNAHLARHKTELLARRIRRFDETSWWHWGRLHHVSDRPRIYVNAKTRRAAPFFMHACNHYDGSILALFPKDRDMDLGLAMKLLNEVDWSDLGFVCDGRFLFSQRTLQTCPLPAEFSQLRKLHVAGKPPLLVTTPTHHHPSPKLLRRNGSMSEP
ncbi:MAG: class I SAM-dependent methyltransferase [Proteobacteria bacterium]|nr:class I SAM-dependent methyltransferase [Pseudomonadota bacterium]HQR03577.1 class I SAM-dependent methyltransferase [Rhodocyclaceae bacterium]